MEGRLACNGHSVSPVRDFGAFIIVDSFLYLNYPNPPTKHLPMSGWR